ncbi:hypothetical protein GSY74_03380 [Sulfurovum sp. bin170]|uniref:hypothetical protein n=1 Tax=Sulfurovum sp. bin170 TaxID=2695268 RepID=UPI0013DF4F18|nr:hypothetical protein [Sulfurovum sp. bin170]NEW60315.1 hypothetical protein [Sulfurovum sp. bin170]
MNLMGSSNRRVLVHRDMESITTTDSVDIILTPQFYTFLREELGVRFAYQAKQIAPSLFDDYLDDSQEYQFHVYKCEEHWCFFAYSVEEITSFLETKGVKIHQISKIFFAQELSSYMENAIDLGSTLSMQSLDGTVALLPKRLMSSDYRYDTLNLENVSFKSGIALSSSYDSFVPLKETIIISSLLLLLGVAFIVEGGRIKSSIQSAIEKEEALLDKNPRLSSSLVRKSILGEYEPIDRRERLKRDSAEQISKLLSAKSILKELTIDDNKISATIETDSTATMKQIETQARSKKFKTKKEGSKQIKMERVI